MQFLLLVLINILMACFFYLILRLKLEKYASDYREKRLKREMDEIINEFNETAERNITILDNRIESIKSLINKSGMIDSIDISLNDNTEEKLQNKPDIDLNNKTSDNHLDESITGKKTVSASKTNSDDKIMKESNSGFLSRLKANIKNNIQNTNKSKMQTTESEKNNEDSNKEYLKNKMASDNSSVTKQVKEKIDIIIDYSHDNLKLKQESENTESRNVNEEDIETDNLSSEEKYSVLEDEHFSEDELENMFSNSKDKYSLISKLYEKGYPADLISRSSGVPIGEIKLVVDLNKSL